MEIDKKLYNEINEFCKLNGLKTRDFIHKILKEGFMREKYGESPFKTPNISEVAEFIDAVVAKVPEIPETPEFNKECQTQLNNLFEEKVKDKEVKTVTVEEAIEIMDRLMSGEVVTPPSPSPSPVVETPKPKKKRKLN